MYKILLFMLVPFFLQPFSIAAQKANYYIEISDSGFTAGEFSTGDFHKKPWRTFQTGEVDTDALLDYFQLKKGNENVLLFFHAMWGNLQPFHKNSMQCFNAQLTGIDKIIAVIWHAKSPTYRKNWQRAIGLGARISPVINSIVGCTANQYTVLCHSMGNRVLEGVVSTFPDTSRRFKTVMLAGADLNAEVFQEGLTTLPDMSDRIVIYMHEKDHLLQASKIVHHRKRLGLDAKAYVGGWRHISNLEVVDVTHARSGHLPSMTNHMYFKNHKEVVLDMNCVLNEDFEARKGGFKSFKDNYIQLK